MAKEKTEDEKEHYDLQGYVDVYQSPGDVMTFNTRHGYLEALVRGFRSGFLGEPEYRQLGQCESLDDFKLCFQETDYIDVLQSSDFSAKLTPQMIEDRVWEKFVEEFFYIRDQATGELATFFHFIQYEYMIKAVFFVIRSILNFNDPLKILPQVDKMGKFPGMRAVLQFESGAENNLKDLYETVLIATPIGKYFERFLESQNVQAKRDGVETFQRIFNEEDIDLITNTVLKFWLEDFYRFCQGLGGETATIMKELLEFEADKRAILVMVHSNDTELNQLAKQKERQRLFCSFGSLYYEGISKFATCNDETMLREILSKYSRFSTMWTNAERNAGDNAIADALQFELEKEDVRLSALAFEGQSHFAAFYAFAKLKAVERTNIRWIAECINAGKKHEIETKLIHIFKKQQ